MCWETNSARCTGSCNFLNTVADKLLSQMVEEFIKHLAILNIILINRQKLVAGMKVVGTLVGSDHILPDFLLLRERGSRMFIDRGVC